MSMFRGLCALLYLSTLSICVCAGPDSQYQVQNIKDNVYRFMSGKYHSAL